VPSWTVDPAEAGLPLTTWLRAREPGTPWSKVKEWVASGKVFVAGKSVREATRLVQAGEEIELRMAAPRRGIDPTEDVRIVWEDAHLVVIEKPSGVDSVPYRAPGAAPVRGGGTAMDLIRDAWRRMGRPATETPLHVVHRIDKETSGLLVYAKSKRAEVALAAQFRDHTVDRTYLCVAHGDVRPGRIESTLVADRGDGLRGSRPGGKRAVTHVSVVRRLRGATLCEVRLETGKTHQIRIHLAERGHPLVGERVYIRDFENGGGRPIPSRRLLLHAATLGFTHPSTGEPLRFESPLPADFADAPVMKTQP
jgi:23S rRNA pseudouridine1911/1915/1917 synthase